jgi:hypothetical protein
VTLDLAGSQRTYFVRPRPLFSRLHPGQRVGVRVVRTEVVEIDLDGDSLPIDDGLGWLVGASGGLLLGGLFVRGGYRRGRAEHSWWWPAESEVMAEAIGDRLGLIVLGAAMALVLSGIVLGVSAWVTNATPPWPVAVVVLAGWSALLAKALSWSRFRTRRTATSGDEHPLVTGIITPSRDGRTEVTFVGDTSLPRGTKLEGLSEASLERLDQLVAHANHRRPLDVQYAWYPWPKSARLRRRGDLPGGHLIFEAERVASGYRASLSSRPDLGASATTFEGLAPAIEALLADRLGIARQPLPGGVTWNRILTQSGFEPFRRDMA